MAQTIDKPKQQDPGDQMNNLFSCLQTGDGKVVEKTTGNANLKLNERTDLDQI